jgi:glycosyltransferase involved in cell wall biosynthesis
MRIDVVIPVYNEGGNIQKTLDGIAEAYRPLSGQGIDLQVNLVYDFDEDNTLPAVRKIQAQYPFPLVLVKNQQRGVVNALKTGFAAALGEYVLVTMADASDDYAILPNIFELAKQGYDVVTPSRYMRGGKLHGGPFVKQLLSRLAGVSVHFLTGIPTHDITNSYKLYKKSLLQGLHFESQGGFEIGMEITAKAFVQGGRIVELPSRWWDRTEGKSKFKLWKWLPKYLKWYFYLLFPWLRNTR